MTGDIWKTSGDGMIFIKLPNRTLRLFWSASLAVTFMVLPFSKVGTSGNSDISAQVESVTVFLSPAEVTLSSNDNTDTPLILMINAGAHELVFARIDLTFDPSMVRLTNIITTNSQFNTEIQKTPIDTANSTGQITIVLGRSPEDPSPTGEFEFAQLDFHALSTSPNQITNIAMLHQNIQIIDINGAELPFAGESAVITLNPVAGQPDLVPYPRPGRQEPVIVSSITGTTTNNTIYAERPTYFDWGFKNVGTVNINTSFYVDLYIDDIKYIHYPYSSLGPGELQGFDDWTITWNTPGWHTVRLVADPDNTVAESNEGNNEWSKQFYWEPGTLNLTVIPSGNGNGAVNSSPAGIDCGSTCSYDFNYNTVVTLTATPAAGSSFTGWSGGGCSGTNTCTVTMIESTSVLAEFSANSPPDLIVQSITPVPSNPQTNEAITFSVVIKNQGQADADGFYIDLFIDAPLPLDCSGVGQAYEYVEGLAAGVSQTVTIGYDGFDNGGNHAVNGIVDTNCYVNESDEGNNTKLINLTVGNTPCFSLGRAARGNGSIPTADPENSAGCSTGQYTAGQSITMTANPDIAYIVERWEGTDDDSSTSTTNTVTMPANNHTVTVNYVPSSVLLTVNKAGTGSGTVTASPAGINCGTDCTETYAYNTMVTLTPVPTPGHNFAGWSGDADCSDGQVTMNASKTCTATFNTVPNYTLIVSKAGNGSGTITSSPAGINCGSDCSEFYPSGTLVALNASPTTGSTFAGWSGDADCTDGQVTMNANKTCTATFNIPPSAEFDAWPVSGTAPLPVEFHIVDTSNMTTCSWDYGDGSPYGTSCNPYHFHTYTNPGTYAVTFVASGPGGSNSITRTNYINVNSALQTLSIDKTGTGIGIITSNPGGIDCGSDCSEGYTSGTVVTLTATASADSTFTGWSGGGCSGIGTCVVTMNAEISVTANFDPVSTPQNLLQNGSFEEDGNGDGKPDIWSTNAKFTRSSETTPNDGGFVGRFRATDNSGATIQQTVQDLTAGSTYNFSGWVNVPATSDAFTFKLQVKWRNASNSAISTKVIKSYTSPTGGWNEATGSLVAPAGTTNALVQMVVSSLNGTIYIDNFSLGGSGSIPSYTLTVNKTGTGNGTVTSTPPGINCGSDCSEVYLSNTSVSLTAAEEPGSIFTGWSGDCSGTGTCTVAMDAVKSVTANFDLQSSSHTLTVNKMGTGSGTVTSSPTGIDCGADCSEHYTSGTVVTLTVTAASGSTFTGWGGDADCSDGQVTMDASKTCIANFDLSSSSPNLLQNPSFEKDDNGDNKPDVWSTNAKFTRSNEVTAIDGNYVGRFRATDNSGATIQHVVPNLTAGNTYDFSGWVNVPATSDAFTFKLQVKWRNASNRAISTKVIKSYTASTGSWNQATASLVAPAGTTNALVQMVVSSLNGTLYVDHFSFGGSGSTPSYTLTINKTGVGNGLITSSPPGVDCGSDCSEEYTANTPVTLTAVADSNSVFYGFSGGGCNDAFPCTVNMTADMTVTANFVLQTDDHEWPIISWLAPVGNNQTYEVGDQTIQLEVSATDNVGITEVIFSRTDYVSGTYVYVEIGRVFSEPYRINFDTSVLLPGLNEISASTYDAAGNGTAQSIWLNHVSSPGDIIFANSFNDDNCFLTEWTACADDGGDLEFNGPPLIEGGDVSMSIRVDDNNVVYITSDHPNAETRYRARFYFDPNSISMANGDLHRFFYGYSGSSKIVLRLEFRRNSNTYQIRPGLLNDGGSWVNGTWVTITDAPHSIEIDWRAATAVGANNGGLTLWIDGVQKANLTADNDTLRIDRVRLGAVNGIDAGTRGTYYFDAFESRRQTYIGP
jgi:hypothetical protein